MQHILVLTLGGTIDALAYPSEESAYPSIAIPSGSNAAFKALLDLADASTTLEQIIICDKDSKDLNEDDIRALQENIKNAQGYQRIIVTMGTDKMREVALVIQQQISYAPCPVLFTGAIWPISNGKKITDAYNNLKLALKTADLQDMVYIAMSGYCEPPENLIKDFSAKRFDLYTQKIT